MAQLTIWKWISLCMIAIFTSIALIVVFYRFDGFFFPVTTPYKITEIIQTSDNTVIIGTDFMKLRECNFENVNWYKGKYKSGSIANRVKVSSSFISPPTIRHDGNQQIFSKVRMTPEEILTNSHAVAIHDCYNGWAWYTTTVLYTGNYNSIADAVADGIKITDNR